MNWIKCLRNQPGFRHFDILHLFREVDTPESNEMKLDSKENWTTDRICLGQKQFARRVLLRWAIPPASHCMLLQLNVMEWMLHEQMSQIKTGPLIEFAGLIRWWYTSRIILRSDYADWMAIHPCLDPSSLQTKQDDVKLQGMPTLRKMS